MNSDIISKTKDDENITEKELEETLDIDKNQVEK